MGPRARLRPARARRRPAPPRGAPSPRVGLTTARVVEEAARLADEDGFEALGLGRLAERVGVRTPSLYKHVDGLPALRRLVALEGLRALHAALAPHDDLDGLCHAYRAFAGERPGLYAATVAAPGPDDAEAQELAQAVVAHVGAVLGGDGDGGGAVHRVRAVRAALHGFVALEAAGGFGLPEDVDASFARLVALLHEA